MRVKPESVVLLTLSAIPLLWLSLFYVFMARIRLDLGHFPAPMVEGSALENGMYDQLLRLSALPIVPCAALLALPWTLIRRPVLPPRIFRVAFALSGLSVVSLILLITIDPGKCIEWFID